MRMASHTHTTHTEAPGHGQERLIERVQPGWWVYSYDGDTGAWGQVHTVFSLTHNATGRKATALRVADANGEHVEVSNWNNELVLCCTKAEAKRAGLVAS